MRRLLVCSLCCVLALPICLGAAEVMLSAPVRLIGPTPQPDPQPANMLQRPAPPEIPRTIRGLLPQYQSVSAFRSDAAKAPNPGQKSTRFLLALPDRLLLLEAAVTINGKPYEMIREQRIDRLIAELSMPVSEEPTPPAEAEAAIEPEAAVDAAEESASEEANEDVKPEEETKEKASQENEGESKPEVEPIPVPDSGLDARLRRYAAVTGRPPTRDEVRWLLTNWIDGPTLLVLDENFQRFRGAQAPAFYVLDRDMDGTVSAKELQSARETLLSCDVNQNDVVEYTEIAEVADDPRRKGSLAPTQGLIPILDAASVAKSFRRLAKRYADPAVRQRFDANTDGSLDSDEIARLEEIEPDVTIVVSFDASDAEKSKVTITQISSSLQVDPQLFRIVGSSIRFPIGGTLLEFSAVQSAALSGSDQISVGVVNDGYPLLPAIDPNEDGRLTIRELRTVGDELKRFDVNEDGGISPEEIPATVRVSIGLGPCVHQHLADIRSVRPPSTSPQVEAPDWFTKMDRNKDGDISPREFLLGKEQFKQLDADGDGLISPAEAVQATKDKPREAKPNTEISPKGTATP